jgi:hypothetical protein
MGQNGIYKHLIHSKESLLNLSLKLLIAVTQLRSTYKLLFHPVHYLIASPKLPESFRV